MTLTQAAKRMLKLVPAVRRFVHERDSLHEKLGGQPTFVPNGSYYSPVPSLAELRQDEARIFGPHPETVPGIDLRLDRQRELLEHFAAAFYSEVSFTEHKGSDRYFFENPAYSYSDAIFLQCMIRHAQPRRIIEVGSGYSSGATLDTNERFFDNRIECTFIEPYPKLLLSLLQPGDRNRFRILAQRVQDVDLSVFEALEPNDILFIDSTHVSKTGSDVNRILFEILPALATGVYVHFHDIFYPFEYPKEWAFEGRAWNETYALRAFLQYNSAFEIVCFNTLLEQRFPEFFAERMPLCLRNPGGSIWLRKAGETV